MTNEQLMKPRYKVIADYPNSPYLIGDIIILAASPTDLWDCERTGSRKLINPVDYPAIFKKLEWWERRNVEDLPEYLRCSKTIGKVKEYGWFKGGNSAKFENDTTEYLSHCEPATKEEYEAYQLTK